MERGFKIQNCTYLFQIYQNLRPDKNYRISSTLLWSVKEGSSKQQQQPAAARIFSSFFQRLVGRLRQKS